MSGEDYLNQIANRMKHEASEGAKPRPERITVRNLLGKYGYQRRSKHIVSRIRNTLEKLELQIVPDFEYWYIDYDVSILLQAEAKEISSEGANDPTVRIGALEAANRRPSFVNPNKPLSAAVTLMQLKDFSQLPVIDGKGFRDVKGVISWKSIGSRLALGQENDLVRDYMNPARVIHSEAPLLDAIDDISEHGYVLVIGTDKSIAGIVTGSDIAKQFLQLASPFLLIGEIEGHLRSLVQGKFTLEQLRGSSPNHEGGHKISGPADLTIGDYCRLLQKPDCWSLLNLGIDRTLFVDRLDAVRKIRNDVMHFDPEGFEPEDYNTLQEFAKFFRDLARMNAI